MKCSKCRHENPEGKKFCCECGAELLLACPQCDGDIRAGDKFCGECGHGLAVPSDSLPKQLTFDEKLREIQRYLPKGLTEKILSQRNRIEGERRQVTIMFCDMVGFTPLSEKLDPEETYGIVDRMYELLIHKVHDYEGTVNEMTGDGIMALFGAPIALEDAPQRAIRSALAIQREISRFSERVKVDKLGLPSIRMRIGIHTGHVVVGTVGNDLRVEFTAVGDAVNLASRMEGLAEPGTVYVTGETFKLAEGFFRFESLGTRAVKGRETPVDVYRVIAPSTRRTRFDVSSERGLTRFVGRKIELDILIRGFEKAKTGRGRTFSITAEAGVGKSRLLYEFRKAVANEDATFLEGKCLSYGSGRAYHPVIDILKATFNIRESDRDPEIRERAVKHLNMLGVDEASTLPYLLELLSVKDSGLDKISMSPEGRKDRIMEALKRIVLKGSEMRPLILAIEDLHWIDKSSEDTFKDLVDCIRGAMIYLIFTYRPEYVPAWGGKSFHSQVNLNRLSQEESLAMASHFLGTEHMEEDVRRLILEKTEGVPFFIEEFIRSAKDLKIIEKKDSAYRMARDVRDVTIPSTIQDVIMARVDALPEGAKTVLQMGSVIEREFDYELIKKVSGFPEQLLLSRLSALRDLELIYERGIFPQSTHVFSHALTRDVVYESIMTKNRKRLHGDIGNAIEKLYKDNIHDHYEVLVEHFIASKNYKKAAAYSKLTAKKAEKKASLNDAITYTKKRVASIEKLPQIDDVEKDLIDARTILGLYFAQMGYYAEAKEAIDPISDLALKYDYKRRLSQIYTIVGAYNLFVKEDYHAAYDHLEKAIKISENTGNIVSFVLANYWMGCAVSWNCKFEKSYFHINKSIEINEAANNLWGIAAMKSNIGMVYYWNGKIDLAYKVSNRAEKNAEESGDMYSKACSYTAHGISCYGKGYFQSAVKHLLKAVDFCVRVGNPLWDSISRFNLGDAYLELGEYRVSQSYNNEAVDLLESYDLMPSFSNLCKIASEKSKVRNNEKDIDLESVFQCHKENKYRMLDGWMARYVADILLNIDERHLSEAEHWIKKAIAADSNNDMRWHLGRDYALNAALHKRMGDMTKAKENLGKAIEILKECGADGWVEKYEKEKSAFT